MYQSNDSLLMKNKLHTSREDYCLGAASVTEEHGRDHESQSFIFPFLGILLHSIGIHTGNDLVV